ncbi:hypothetical protein IMZ48_21650 [Candidatus Bathyarchaeota archaeon]|nr:hypothetical protein [Candidatus Bathyarchaeota archaeon]
MKEFRDGERSGNLLDISKEIGLMIEIDDVLDELHTLDLVLTEQKMVVEDLNQTLRNVSGKHLSYVKMKTLSKHLLRIDQMEKMAGKADKSVSSSLYLASPARLDR